jgi:hypothetical protein
MFIQILSTIFIYKKSYSVKQIVFKKQEFFFETWHFLQNLDCSG